MKRYSLLQLQSYVTHGLGLLLVIILLIVAQDFVGTRPAMAAMLVFGFSLSYLAAAAVRNNEANYLYGGMLLGAAASFMGCYSLGAPVNWFPPLSLGGAWEQNIISRASAFTKSTFVTNIGGF